MQESPDLNPEWFVEKRLLSPDLNPEWFVEKRLLSKKR